MPLPGARLETVPQRPVGCAWRTEGLRKQAAGLGEAGGSGDK